MRQNKLLSLLLCFAMLISLLTGVAYAKTPADAGDHWAEETLTKWYEGGLLKGYDDGRIDPDGTVTRGQFITLMNRALDFTASGDATFTDVTEDTWCAKDVAIAVGMGYTSGYADDTFRPNAPVNRQQAAKFIALAKEMTTAVPSFNDSSNIAIWAKPYVGALQKAAITEGDKQGNFNPTDVLTRAQCVVMLDRVMTDIDGTLLTICHTNDMHGFFLEGDNDGMGAAKIATLMHQQEVLNPNTLVLDAGDAIQGNNLVTLNDGEAAIKIMNAMGYDAMTAGNHEFDYGSARLLELTDMADFPILAANIKDAKGGTFLPELFETTVGGVKIGVFGLDTPETTFMSHPDNTRGLLFKNPVTTAKKMAKKLDARNDVVICLAHLGDLGEFDSAKLADIDSIDLIIDGHTHSTYDTGKTVDDSLIVSTGEHTKNLGVVKLVVKDGEVTSKTAKLISKDDATTVAEDTKVKAVVDTAKVENDKISEEVVAHTDIVLDGERADVRTGETNLGNLITNSLKDISGADVALTNGGGIRTSIDKGDITKGDVLAVLPFGNTVRVIELTGADLMAAIENGIDTYPEAKGAFPHVAGITVVFDSSKPAGKRVVSMKVNGAPIDAAKTYTVATNDFLVAGGDGYTMLTGKKVVGEYGAMDEVLIDYINDNETAIENAAVRGTYTDVSK